MVDPFGRTGLRSVRVVLVVTDTACKFHIHSSSTLCKGTIFHFVQGDHEECPQDNMSGIKGQDPQ